MEFKDVLINKEFVEKQIRDNIIASLQSFYERTDIVVKGAYINVDMIDVTTVADTIKGKVRYVVGGVSCDLRII